MSIDVALSYGVDQLSITLPEELDISVIRKPAMPGISESSTALSTAFEDPVCSPSLNELAMSANKVCILICDITRPVPNGIILPSLLQNLLSAGIDQKNITIVVATGLHRPNEGNELLELIGNQWVYENFDIKNHFARDDDCHTFVGTTSLGTNIRLDKRFVSADLRIVVGLVEPHFMAGWSGGRKLIAPGIAHVDTITTLHNSNFIEAPGCTSCNLENNLLHEEQLEIVNMIGGAYAINVVIDEMRVISLINFGEIVRSHLKAVDFVSKYAGVKVKNRFPTVITSAAGYPLDKTYYQTIKGIVAPLDILEPGGNLIIVSACSEGMGSKEFIESQRRLIINGPKKFLEQLHLKKHASIDEWQTEMLLKALRIGNIWLYTSGLSEEEHGLTGILRVTSLNDTIKRSLATAHSNRIAIIPEGPYVVPICSS